MEFVYKLKISIILSIYHYELTEWEENFIEGIQDKESFSLKQKTKLDEIWESIRKGTRSFNYHTEGEFRRAQSPYSEELGLAYDDVHNFDK